jgi:hypothetical protein
MAQSLRRGVASHAWDAALAAHPADEHQLALEQPPGYALRHSVWSRDDDADGGGGAPEAVRILRGQCAVRRCLGCAAGRVHRLCDTDRTKSADLRSQFPPDRRCHDQLAKLQSSSGGHGVSAVSHASGVAPNRRSASAAAVAALAGARDRSQDES